MLEKFIKPVYSICCVLLAVVACSVVCSQDAFAKEIKPVAIQASSESSSSSVSKYGPKQLLDNNASTPWVAAPGRGRNEWVAFDFGKKVTISAIDIRNGYQRTGKTYRNNSRVKILTVKADGKKVSVLNLQDAKDWQRYVFPDVKAKVLSFHVEGIFKGAVDSEVALADVRFYTESAPAVKQEKREKGQKRHLSPANSTKRHVKFFAMLDKLSEPEAALATLKEYIAAKTVHPDYERQVQYATDALETCQAMLKNQLSVNGASILAKFSRAFPHHGDIEVVAPLLSIYGQNPYFDIESIYLSQFENEVELAFRSYQQFCDYLDCFKTYLPAKNKLETLQYIKCVTDLLAEASRFTAFEGNKKMRASLRRLKKELIAQVSNPTPDGNQGGLALYQGWISGMTIDDVYAKIMRDGLRYDLSSLMPNHFYISTVEGQGMVYNRERYNEEMGRSGFMTTFDLTLGYDYPRRKKLAPELESALFKKSHARPSGLPFTVQTIYLPDENLVLLLTEKDGLFSLTKSTAYGENQLEAALAKKYGPTMEEDDGLNQIKLGYQNVVGNLYIFTSFRHDINYADTRVLEKLFDISAVFWDEESKQKDKGLMDDI